jgi:hypothetical protein
MPAARSLHHGRKTALLARAEPSVRGRTPLGFVVQLSADSERGDVLAV